VALAPGRDVRIVAALALARIGDSTRTKALVEQLEKSEKLHIQRENRILREEMGEGTLLSHVE
jgi:HEAT repeat protein